MMQPSVTAKIFVARTLHRTTFRRELVKFSRDQMFLRNESEPDKRVGRDRWRESSLSRDILAVAVGWDEKVSEKNTERFLSSETYITYDCPEMLESSELHRFASGKKL